MINIALLGFGVVGGGTAEVFETNAGLIAKRAGDGVYIKYICDLLDFPGSPFADRIIHDFNIILNDPEISIVVETIGGSGAAYKLTKAALAAGKHVVTSNKEVVAKFGAELIELAAANGVSYMFEASVGGGIPIIGPLLSDLAANDITEICGILNGTTNYILTRMSDDGVSFGAALEDAKKRGFAEADPTDDVEGIDACRKICILAAIAFGKMADTAEVRTEGITAVRPGDIANAGIAGYSIKLLARARFADGKMLLSVAPMLAGANNPVANVSGVYNAVLVRGNMIGDAMFYGRGAGKLPTASAVASDVMSICANPDKRRMQAWECASREDLADFGDQKCKNYFSFDGINSGGAGVNPAIAKILGIFGDVRFIDTYNGEIAFITGEVTENKAALQIAKTAESGLRMLSRIRVL